jgi:hypothetical protein
MTLQNTPLARAIRRDTKGAAEYLRITHGIDFTEKTLRNRRAKGLGPYAEYLEGFKPFYMDEELDRYAAEAFGPRKPRRQAVRTADTHTNLLARPAKQSINSVSQRSLCGDRQPLEVRRTLKGTHQ